MQATCSVCSRPFEARRSSAKFCGPTCRKRASRRVEPESAPATPQRGAATPAAGADPGQPRLVAMAIEELTAAGRLDTLLGQQAVDLATRIAGASFDTGSSIAAMHKQLAVLQAEALKGAQKAMDPMDELKARRARKLAG